MRHTSHHYRLPNYIDIYHLEGDVWSHTVMVVDYVINHLKRDNNDLYIASIFHDVGKTYNYIKIKESVIRYIYNTTSFPSLSEFDEIFVV